jgi:hypothetical protein
LVRDRRKENAIYMLQVNNAAQNNKVSLNESLTFENSVSPFL